MDPLAPHRRRWLLAVAGLSLLGTLAFGAAMRRNDQALRPHSIVTLEIALDQEDAQQLLRFWGPNGRAAARRSVLLDFGFILLGYAPLLASLCLLSAGRLADRWRSMAKALARAAGAAGILDLIENVALLSVLAGPTAPATYAAGVSALGKFVLVGAVVVFLVVVGLAFPLARLTPLVRWFVRAPGLAIIALVVLAVVWRVALSSFGIPDLFWDERPFAQGMAGIGVGALLAHLGVLGFLLDAQRAERSEGRGRAEWAAGIALSWPLRLVPRLQEGAVLLVGYMVRAAVPLVGVAAASVIPVPGGVPRLWLPLGGLVALTVATVLYVTLSSVGRVQRAAVAHPRIASTAFPSILGLALLVLMCQLLLFGFLLVLYRLGWPIPVALTVCVLLGAIASAYALVKLLFSTYVVAVLTLAAITYVSVNAPGGHRLPGLDYYGRVPLARPAVEHPGGNTYLEAWRGRQGGASPLVVVAVDGGGIRAATWASIVMAQLERDVPAFPYHVRLVTGASGGMVGLASYVASLDPPDSVDRHRDLDGRPLQPAELVRRVAADSLGDVARALVFEDLILPPFLHRTADRGLALEQAWERNTRILGRPFAELAAGEAAGWRPSLLVSPVLVEDGRRLLISNGDVSSLLKVPGEHPALQALSYYGHIEPWPGTLRLSTAVRLNASFPYVSPPAELPTDPPRHALDAGYYDEHGVELAGTWIWQHRKWLLEQTSGVLLVQVPDARARDRRASVEADRRGWWGAGLLGLTGPIETLRASQSAANDYRNDQLVRLLDDELNDSRPGFFATVVFEPDETPAASPPAGCDPSWLRQLGGRREPGFRDIALSWRLTGCEVSRLKEAIRGQEHDPSCLERRRLESWWNAHRGASAETVSIACPPPPL